MENVRSCIGLTRLPLFPLAASVRPSRMPSQHTAARAGLLLLLPCLHANLARKRLMLLLGEPSLSTYHDLPLSFHHLRFNPTNLFHSHDIALCCISASELCKLAFGTLDTRPATTSAKFATVRTWAKRTTSVRHVSPDQMNSCADLVFSTWLHRVYPALLLASLPRRTAHRTPPRCRSLPIFYRQSYRLLQK